MYVKAQGFDKKFRVTVQVSMSAYAKHYEIRKVLRTTMQQKIFTKLGQFTILKMHICASF